MKRVLLVLASVFAVACSDTLAPTRSASSAANKRVTSGAPENRIIVSLSDSTPTVGEVFQATAVEVTPTWDTVKTSGFNWQQVKGTISACTVGNSDGVVTAVRTGYCYVYAHDGTLRGSITVTVSP